MARSFTLRIVSVTVARVNVNATTVDFLVPASNNPHGSVELASSDPLTTAEAGPPLQLSLVRTGGLIGTLRVNFTAILDSANDMDFGIEESCKIHYMFSECIIARLVVFAVIVIPTEASTALIMVDIVDDTIPELDEIFSISLTSVELVDGAVDTIPPSLGSNTLVDITIAASDDPFGFISIAQDTFTTSEGSTLTIPLLRVGGSLGVVTISYATLSGRGVAPDDYAETAGNIVFVQGQTTAEVFVPIVDDSLPEIVEDFEFMLVGVTGGSLGNITRATVLIAASDSPFGVVGFATSAVNLGVSVANPVQQPAVVSLVVTRMGGSRGNTDIRWNVVGPGSDEVPSSDIAASSISGTLSLADGQE